MGQSNRIIWAIFEIIFSRIFEIKITFLRNVKVEDRVKIERICERIVFSYSFRRGVYHSFER